MATQFYVEEADRSSESGVADESIDAGTLVYNDGAGVDLVTFADGEYTGLTLYDPEYLSAEDEDATSFGTYESGDRVRYHPREGGARVRIHTIEETADGVTSAPSIDHMDVVGIVDETDGDAPTSKGKIVEEGYTNDENGDSTTTTFNRSNNNFLAVGYALRPGNDDSAVTDFNKPVRVRLFSDVES